MNRRAIIATHHKTGTVWLGNTFRAICRKLGIPFTVLDHAVPETASGKPPIVILDYHGRWFGRAAAEHHIDDDRVLHVIRDPRDVIISAMHYHRVATEAWLQTPQEKFDGMTYQQKINSLPDDHARYIFEMDNSAGGVIRSLSNWNYKRASCFECKYEDLMADTEADLFGRVAAHLGFDKNETKICQRHFRRNSLFSGAPQEKAQREGKAHIRAGGTQQWLTVFDDMLANEFLRRFDDVLIRLGYDTSHAWAESARALSSRVHAAAPP